jgi:aquaporin Z
MSMRALLAEFIGTFALLFVIFMVGNNTNGTPVQLLSIALAVGLTIVCMATAFGPISGGHFNPCVTFAMVVAKQMDAARALVYWVVQALGGIAAVFTGAFLLGEFGAAARSATSLSRGPGVEMVAALVAEALAAFFFVTVIFLTAVHQRAPKNGALYLGLALTFGILAIGPISGGGINPAVGIALSVGSGKWDNAVAWAVGPLIGAGLAAVCYTGLWSKSE